MGWNGGSSLFSVRPCVMILSLSRRLDGMIAWDSVVEVLKWRSVCRPKRRAALLVTVAQRRDRLNSNRVCLRQTSRRCQRITVPIDRAGKLSPPLSLK